MNPDLTQNIPQVIRETPQWVVWRLEPTKKDKLTKVPYVAISPQKKAASTRTSDWGTFGDALRAYLNPENQLDGIGFVFSKDDDFVGFDLDKCRDPETGQVAPWALHVLERLPTYCEVSPSGTGIKGIAIGKLPGDGTKRAIKKVPSLAKLDPNAHPEAAIEMYDRGRFFTLTGERI